MAELNRNNILKELVAEIPEIYHFLSEELDWWNNDEPGLHNIFGNVLNPFLIDIFANKDNQELKTRVFKFLERMANSSDDYITNVLALTILERLGDETLILIESYNYMGPKTHSMSDEVETWLGRM